MHYIEGALPAGEKFARVLGDMKGTVRLTCVVLDGQAGAVTAGYEPGGGYAGTVVADGGELDGCAYRDIAGEELVTVTVDKDASPLAGEGKSFRGFRWSAWSLEGFLFVILRFYRGVR